MVPWWAYNGTFVFGVFGNVLGSRIVVAGTSEQRTFSSEHGYLCTKLKDGSRLPAFSNRVIAIFDDRINE